MRPIASVLLMLALALTAPACGRVDDAPAEPVPAHAGPERSSLAVEPSEADTAVFAMGCFWCAETAFEGTDGVASVTSGFAGGTLPDPTYDQVTAGGTGHYESVQVIYAPARVHYETLLRIFWHNIDPLDDAGQFCDRGDSYRAAIFTRTTEQARLADASRDSIRTSQRFEGTVVTEVLPAGPFYPAEDYHQDFWLKDPDRYHSYRTGCRRDERLNALWGPAARVASAEL